MTKLKYSIRKFIFNIFVKLWRNFFELGSLSNRLTGDRCVEFAFVIKNLLIIENKKDKKVLDIGCFASPLTTIIKEIGFMVEGIDLFPSPYVYEGITYFKEDFLLADLKNSFYDIIVLCSTIEHIGLEGRYGSQKVINGDIKALEKIQLILKPKGIMVLTIPYGEEKTIKSLHRVYNKKGKLLKHIYDNFEIVEEEFYKNNEKNMWVKCDEIEARRVIPSENNYALGLFVFRKK